MSFPRSRRFDKENQTLEPGPGAFDHGSSFPSLSGCWIQDRNRPFVLSSTPRGRTPSADGRLEARSGKVETSRVSKERQQAGRLSRLLEEKEAALKARAESEADLAQRLAGAEAEVRLLHEAQDAVKAKAAARGDRAAELEGQVADLQSALADRELELQEAADRAEGLCRALDEEAKRSQSLPSKDEITRLKLALQAAQKAADQNSAVQEALHEARCRVVALEAEVANVAQENEELARAARSQRDIQKEVQPLVTKLRAAEARLQAAEDRASDADTRAAKVEKELREARQKCCMFEAQLRRKAVEVESQAVGILEERLEVANSALQQQEDQNVELHRDIAGLRVQLAKAEAELVTAREAEDRCQELEEERAGLHERLAALECEVSSREQLDSVLHNLGSGGIASAHHRQRYVESLRQENQRLRDELREKTEKLYDLESSGCRPARRSTTRNAESYIGSATKRPRPDSLPWSQAKRRTVSFGAEP